MHTRAIACAAAAGAALGAAAGTWQLATLPWGALGADQHLQFWAFFVGAGALAVTAIAWVPGRLAGWGAVRSIAAAVALAAAAFGLFVPRNVRALPPVLLLVTDTTRADHLSLHGYHRDTTPFLRELATRSVVFDQAYSQGSHTVVSTPSIVASCYPSEHGVDGYAKVLAPEHELISEVLAEAGWYTCGIVTNPHVSSKNGFDQGFASFELFGRGNASVIHADSVNTRFMRRLDFHRPAWEQGDGVPGAPLFAFIFYTDPHAPYIAPREFQDLWVPEGDDSTQWVVQTYPDSVQSRDAPWVGRLIAQYDATISSWDESFRVLSGELDARGEWQDALVIYTSDHGEEFFEHGKYGHGHALWEEVVRVPLLLSFPVPIRLPPLARTTRRTDCLVSGVDVLPTVLEYLRLEIPSGASGTSALGVALGRSARGDREVFLEEILETYQRYDLRGVRAGSWKYIVRHRGDGEGGETFLFDLARDPEEQENRVDSEPEIVERLQDLLVEHSRAIAQRTATPGSMEPDEEHLRMLRGLGYID